MKNGKALNDRCAPRDNALVLVVGAIGPYCMTPMFGIALMQNYRETAGLEGRETDPRLR